MNQKELKADGQAVALDDTIFITPGLTGVVSEIEPDTSETRSAEQTTQAFADAIANTNLEGILSYHITDAENRPLSPDTQARSTHDNQPGFAVSIPVRNEAWGQLIFYTDENGVSSWHIPEIGDAPEGAKTNDPHYTYTLPARVSPVEDDRGDKHRSIVGAIGKKIIKVLAYELADAALGAVGSYFVNKWELANRPYHIRTVTSENYRSPQAPGLQAGDWEHLGRGRALLFIHGTNSQTHLAFNGLSPECVQQLSAHYDGRVFALDHLTLSEDPQKNVNWFLNHLPENQSLDLDIICHSRGGHVSRLLAEHQDRLALNGRKIAVHKIVFVGSPNAGTVLADMKHMGTYIDTITNIFNVIPDNGVTETLEGIITVTKQLASGVIQGLDGIQSMCPGSEFMTMLNHSESNATQYYAISSNYEPIDKSLKAFVADRLLDSIFQKDNDLVVPTDGVHAANGSEKFPIEQQHTFTQGDGVVHTQFFKQIKTQELLTAWLKD